MDRKNRLRIAFMGTPEFAVPTLRGLLKSGHRIPCVFTQPPKPKGRRGHVSAPPVYEFARANDIPVHTPESLKRNREYFYKIITMNLDLIVVAAYGIILPKEILDAPRYGCLNVHASLLPRWRGASPIQQAILAGDKQSGVSIMQMDEGLDTGDVVAMRSVALGSHTTASLLHDQLSMLGAEMIRNCARRIGLDKEKPPATTQDAKGITYAPVLSREDGRIDWNKSAAEIDRQTRALNPWPGVWTTLGKKRIKIIKAAPSWLEPGEKPGTMVDRKGTVACGEGTALKIYMLQPEGKKPMNADAAFNGGCLETGSVFS